MNFIPRFDEGYFINFDQFRKFVQLRPRKSVISRQGDWLDPKLFVQRPEGTRFTHPSGASSADLADHLRAARASLPPSHHVRYEYVQVHYPLGYKSESDMAKSVVLLASISCALAVDFYDFPRRSN